MTTDIEPLDLTISEVQRLRGEGRSTVKKKIRDGRYKSYLSGRRRKVVVASVLADRDREMRET